MRERLTCGDIALLGDKSRGDMTLDPAGEGSEATPAGEDNLLSAVHNLGDDTHFLDMGICGLCGGRSTVTPAEPCD